jgi:hypothetical protein
MLFTITSERVASGLSGRGDMRESKDAKTTVLPAPVGRETPILLHPCARASRQASMQDC